MAFEGLSDRLESAFKNLRSKGSLTEADVRSAMREVRMALLEADVNYKVAKDFTNTVTEKAIGEIMAANPGMNRETAKELANFRLELKKMKAEKPEEDRNEAMLSELENFLSKHSGEGIEKISNGVLEEWEGGIPLETAFEKHRLFKENEKLFAEIEKMKKRE